MSIKLYVPEYKKEEFKKKCEELGLRLIISKNSMFDYSFYFTEIENNFIRHGMDFDHFEQDERKEITIDEFLKLENLDEQRKKPCPNCREMKKECACMRNKCIECGNPVGNITFTVCDECWGKDKPVNRTHEEIMDRNNWFKDGTVWQQVKYYEENNKTYYLGCRWHKKEFFNTLKMSKGTPPE